MGCDWMVGGGGVRLGFTRLDSLLLLLFIQREEERGEEGDERMDGARAHHPITALLLG